MNMHSFVVDINVDAGGGRAGVILRSRPEKIIKFLFYILCERLRTTTSVLRK